MKVEVVFFLSTCKKYADTVQSNKKMEEGGSVICSGASLIRTTLGQKKVS